MSVSSDNFNITVNVPEFSKTVPLKVTKDFTFGMIKVMLSNMKFGVDNTYYFIFNGVIPDDSDKLGDVGMREGEILTAKSKKIFNITLSNDDYGDFTLSVSGDMKIKDLKASVCNIKNLIPEKLYLFVGEEECNNDNSLEVENISDSSVLSYVYHPEYIMFYIHYLSKEFQLTLDPNTILDDLIKTIKSGLEFKESDKVFLYKDSTVLSNTRISVEAAGIRNNDIITVRLDVEGGF